MLEIALMFHVSGRFSIIILLVVLAVLGCSHPHDDAEFGHEAVGARPPEKADGQPAVTQVDPSWLPSALDLKCAVPGGCPPQVGVLVFPIPSAQNANEVFLYRCTAFLIEPGDKIISSGHCDFSNQAQGVFISRTDLPGKFWRKVKLRFKNFTPSMTNGKSGDPAAELLSGHPDVAVFQLDSPVTDFQGLVLPPESPRVYQNLTAWVVNSASSTSQLILKIERKDCAIHRHERYFPFDLREKPDVLTAFDCSGVEGNSGAPLLADGIVEAIWDGTAREIAGNTLPYERHSSIEATNLRCVDFSGKQNNKCLHVTDNERKKRFISLQERALKKINERTNPNAQSYATAFQTIFYDLKNDAALPNRAFELLYYPICRKGEINKVLFPSEYGKIVYDEWAMPTIQILNQSVSPARITSRAGDTYSLAVDWVPAPGEYLSAEQSPRVALGRTFPIALPLCSR